MEKQEAHIPVLMGECIQNLGLSAGKTIVDATLGGGGHAGEILKRILPGGKLIGVDKDEEAIERCQKRFSGNDKDILYLHGDFKELPGMLAENGVQKVDGILIDLGVSSFQLEDAERGFSYNQDARLDMRMDKRSRLSAYEVVNGYGKAELAKVIRDYGEEKWASRIADFIDRRRNEKKIETTAELTEVIKNAIPAAARRSGPHPAKRTFQAIRIEVNGELAGLEKAIYDFAELLNPGGRLCVIAFHSLEDRIVKQAMKKLYNPCECPPDAPVCLCGKVRSIRIITTKPIVPGEEEILENARARSAKLRVIEKLF
jgi:16S rRNA (cytosine1402-N4)-methyltransferase